MALIGCGDEAPAPAEPSALAHSHGPVSSVQSAELSKHLAELRRLTASWHNPDKAAAAGYTLNLGCIDERNTGASPAVARGMGYHVTVTDGLGNVPLLTDDKVELLEPEFLVYSKHPVTGELKLAAFDYFIPASAAWPGPNDGGVPPTLLGMPMRWSPAFSGWIFHIWSWEHNPDGMLVDFNPAIPLCDCEVSPTTPICS